MFQVEGGLRYLGASICWWLSIREGEKLVHQQGLAESSGNGDRVGGQSPVSGLLQGCGWDQEIAIEVRRVKMAYLFPRPVWALGLRQTMFLGINSWHKCKLTSKKLGLFITRFCGVPGNGGREGKQASSEIRLGKSQCTTGRKGKVVYLLPRWRVPPRIGDWYKEVGREESGANSPMVERGPLRMQAERGAGPVPVVASYRVHYKIPIKSLNHVSLWVPNSLFLLLYLWMYKDHSKYFKILMWWLFIL